MCVHAANPVERWQDLNRWLPVLDGLDEAAAVLDPSIFLLEEKKWRSNLLPPHHNIAFLVGLGTMMLVLMSSN